MSSLGIEQIMSHVTPTTGDLSDQPNLVVVYLGTRVRTLGKSVERVESLLARGRQAFSAWANRRSLC